MRNGSHQEMRTHRVNSALYFDLSQGDGDMGGDMEVTQTNEAGVQAKAQTNDIGVQAKAQTNVIGVQAKSQASSSGVQARPPLNRLNTKGTQATEDNLRK